MSAMAECGTPLAEFVFDATDAARVGRSGDPDPAALRHISQIRGRSEGAFC